LAVNDFAHKHSRLFSGMLVEAILVRRDPDPRITPFRQNRRFDWSEPL
jgi:hypothetical protein